MYVWGTTVRTYFERLFGNNKIARNEQTHTRNRTHYVIQIQFLGAQLAKRITTNAAKIM